MRFQCQNCRPVLLHLLALSCLVFTPALGEGVDTEAKTIDPRVFANWQAEQRHKLRKKKYPDEPAARGRPYEGIENLRPESVAAVEAFLMKQAAPTQ